MKLKLESSDKKYKVVFSEADGNLEIFRHDEKWDESVLYANFFIDLIYKFENLEQENQKLRECVEFVSEKAVHLGIAKEYCAATLAELKEMG